jgi:hypothetical protein
MTDAGQSDGARVVSIFAVGGWCPQVSRRQIYPGFFNIFFGGAPGIIYFFLQIQFSFRTACL